MAEVVELQVTPVSSDPSLTSLNGDTSDVTELNQVKNDILRSDDAELRKENSRLLEDIKRLKDDNERLCLERSTNDEKMANIVDELKKELESVRKAYGNPKLLFTLNQPPHPMLGFFHRPVFGFAMLDNYLYIVYERHNTVQVFDFDDHCKKIKDIEVKEMRSPGSMVGSSVTSQLFISEMTSDVILRVDSKTKVSDVFVKTGYKNTRLSLVENRLLVTSGDSLLMFDIVSGDRIKEIPLTEDIKKDVYHAIESNRDSFFVCHGQFDNNNTVSEIDSEGRVIRVFDNKKQFDCYRLELDLFGRLLVADLKNNRVVLFDENLKYVRILIDNKSLDNALPLRLNYNKNNRLTVGLGNGKVKIFEW